MFFVCIYKYICILHRSNGSKVIIQTHILGISISNCIAGSCIVHVYKKL